MLTAPRPTRPRKGRHRAPSRWSLYRSSHRDRDGNLVSLLIPAWRGEPHRPGDGRPPTIIDLTTTPTVPLPPARRPIGPPTPPAPKPVTTPGGQAPVTAPPRPAGPSIAPRLDPLLRSLPVHRTWPEPLEIPHHGPDWQVPVVANEVIVPPERPIPLGPLFGPPITLGPEFGPARPPEPPATPPAAPLLLGPVVDLRDPKPAPPPPPAPLRTTERTEPISVVVDRSVLLPLAGEERGTFANMLGFGEDEVYYGPTAAIRLDAPTPTYELAAHAITVPVEEVTSEWDTLPGLADVAHDDTTDTGTLVGRLWEATADQPILGHVEVAPPDAPNRILLGAKRWRWSVIGGLAIAVVLVFTAGSAVGRRPIEEARARAVAYTQSAQRLAAALGPVDQAGDLITTIDGTDFDIGPIVASLDALDGVARDVAELTAEELPSPALLGSSTEIDRLEQPQHLLQQAASAASTIERRLGDALTYRIEFDQAFVLPELPVTAAPEQVGDIGASLSVAIASTEAVLAGLPADPFFLSHHEDAEALLADITERHVDYLDALRQGDPATAGVVRREMVVAIAALREGLDEPMMAMSTWADGQLESLRQLIARADDTLR